MKLEITIQDLFEQRDFGDFNGLIEELAKLAVNMGMEMPAFVEELDKLKIYLQEKEAKLNDELFAKIRQALLGSIKS